MKTDKERERELKNLSANLDEKELGATNVMAKP